MNSYSDINQKQTRALFFLNVLPSQISVHINTCTFSKKTKGTVGNTTAWSFLHLSSSYLYCFSEEAFPERCLFKNTPLSHSIGKPGLSFSRRIWNKLQKFYHISAQTTIVTWYTAGKLHVREASFMRVQTQGLFPTFSAGSTSSSTPPTRACRLPSATFPNTTFRNQSEHSL